MMHITITRTNSDAHFITLVALPDAELEERYGLAQVFFGQFNSLAQIKQIAIAMAGDEPACGGGIKEYNTSSAAVKHMFVNKSRQRHCGCCLS